MMVLKRRRYVWMFGITSGIFAYLNLIFPAGDIASTFKVDGCSSLISKFDNDYLFQRKPETKHISCGRVLRGDQEYIKNITRDRPVLRSRKLNMSCSEVKARILPQKCLKNLNFGVAYARIVYENYEFIEDEIKSSYHPQNFFCFSVDSKAEDDFYSNILALSICLPNVFTSPTRHLITGRGYNMNQAHYDCLKLFSKVEGWQYVILLQNYDMMIKSVYETVSILKQLNGANDICARPPEKRRWNHTAKWDARSLKLFRNESQATATQLAANLTVVRDMVQSSISRAAVEWAVNTVDLTTLINQINTRVYGTDEFLWASLQLSDDLQMPGRFTGKCRNGRVPCITRTAFWHSEKTMIRCPKYRHTACIFGIENLQLLSASKNLMVNKPYPAFDYAIADCVHELIFNRTHLSQIDHSLDLQFYGSLENESNGSGNIILVGNSIAYVAYPLIHSILKGRYRKFRLYAKERCAPLSNWCPDFSEAMRKVVEHEEPDILLNMHFSTYDPFVVPFNNIEVDQVYKEFQGNTNFISKYTKYIVIDMPYYGPQFAVGKALARKLQRGLPLGDEFVVTWQQYLDQTQYHRKRLSLLNCSKCIMNEINEVRKFELELKLG